MSNRKGDRAERELSNWLEDEMGWYAQRTASSGSATDRARPDVYASRDEYGTPWGRIAMVEVKSYADGTVTLAAEEIEDLAEAAHRAGAEAWVVVKPDLRKHGQWHCYALHELHETPSGNYSVRKVDHPGSTREEVFQ